MKKIISIISLILIMTFALGFASITAFAEEGDIKLKVSAYLLDATKVEVASYTDMQKGWSEAMELASDRELMKDKGYIYVVVDILDDWTAKNGKFNSDSDYETGYYSGALYVPEKAFVMINLNGHTLDRGLEDYKYNGEVLCVGKKADLVVNGGKDQNDGTVGTITGGFSCNGAGGIHIHDGADVLLNSVSVSGNSTEDDDGAGIALYNGAVLTVNGGSISNNSAYASTGAFIAGFLGFTNYTNYGAGVYAKDATATFNNVTFTGNRGFETDGDAEGVYGDVIAARNSSVSLFNCKVFENSVRGENKDCFSNVFYLNDSQMIVKGCEIYDNASDKCYIFRAEHSTLEISSSKIYGNGADYIILSDCSSIEMYKSEVRDNDGGVMLVLDDVSMGQIYTSTFNNNSKKLTDKPSFSFSAKLDDFYFDECNFGNSTFKNKDNAQYGSSHTATMVSNNSIIMITSIAALAIAVAALVLVIVNNKRSKSKAE